MNIAVSGSEGFLGKYVCELLARKKYSLIKIDITNGIDLCNISELSSIGRFDCFIHLANIVYVPASYENPELFYRVNFLTTLNALELCRKYNARLIYISSYIYGEPDYLPVDEKHLVKPFNPYAQTKVICENLCQGYNRDFNVKVSILRPFNIYGHGQKGQLLIPDIISQIKKGQKEILLKAATPKRDFVHVKDVANAIGSCINDTTNYNVYNVCSGRSVSVEEITRIVNKNLIHPVHFSFSPSDRIKELDETLGSYHKINQELNWKPIISLEEGIKDIIDAEKL